MRNSDADLVMRHKMFSLIAELANFLMLCGKPPNYQISHRWEVGVTIGSIFNKMGCGHKNSSVYNLAGFMLFYNN